VIACLVIASTGVYYAAFLATLVLTTGGVRLLMAREWRPLVSGVILIGIIGFGLLVNLSPSLLYWRDHGKNEAVAQRSVEESDFYALRPIQMLSPIPGYRIDLLGKITNRVFRAPNNSEATQFLGVIGALGFLGLLVLLLAGVGRRDRDRSPPLLFRLASLTAMAVFFGVTGGFSWVLGFAGLKEIRAWNRISVFIAFFALVAVALFLDRMIARTREFPYKRLAAGAFAVLLVGIGIFDQTSKAIVPDSNNFANEWNSDAVFVKDIEDTLGPGESVFQLPYLPFPEGELDVPPYGMVDYDPLRGYVHSSDLNWGYGGAKGRAADWQAQVVKKPTPEMLAAITAVGFRGLWIDRLGYPEQAKQIEAEVQQATGQSPLVSPNGRFVFYDLRDYAQQVRADLGAAGVRKLRTETLADLGR
jgi:phosphoglycerol transferase